VTTVAWWHCFAGIAGDMALGSLVVVGIDNGFGAAHAVLRILGPSGDPTGSSGRPDEPGKFDARDVEAGDIVR
jgi:hypothetical protein